MATRTQHDPHDLALTLFGITLPTTVRELKSAFRAKAKELHTDVSGQDTHDAFIKMRAAYEYLTELLGDPHVFSEGGEIRTDVTVDGTPLSGLGLGLGPTVNGMDCERCDRRGYTIEHGVAYRVCDECDSFGKVPRTLRCKYCNGSGKFTQRRTGRIVPCLICKGTGIFVHPHLTQPCPRCYGTKTVYERRETTYYQQCSDCRGTGELPMWNPVILKNSLA